MMTVLKKNEVDSALTKKGFKKKKTHHIFYYLYVDGYDVGIFTKISHSHKEIFGSLISSMAKQIGISKSEFIDVVNCPINREGLLNLLRNKYQRIP